MIFPLSQNDISAKKHFGRDSFQPAWTAWHAGAILCFAVGFLSLVSGILLFVISWLTASALFVVIASAAIIATFLLMTFGAHCLDKLDLMEKAERKKRLYN